MRILWVSSLAWKGESDYPYPVNGAGAVSGSLFQQTLIEEIEKQGHIVDVVSDYPYAGGENVRHQVNWEHREGAEDVSVKTIDIPYVSIVYKAHSLRRAIKTKIQKYRYDIAIAYLIHQPYLSGIAYAKKLDPAIKTVLICPDLPDMMDMSLKEKKIKQILKALDKKRIESLYKKIDGFVLFAEAMKEQISVSNAKSTVIEGVATLGDLDVSSVKKEDFILYAGTLHKNIGVEQIVDALDYIENPSVKLKIYGTGELESFVKERSEKNPRVIYGGFIDRRTLFEEQKKATVLVNARNPKDMYTRYSFPSKTFEYLYSGTPFLTTKLEGVPGEYSEYLFEIENNMPETIANGINQILKESPEELKEKGVRARRFVQEQKNATQQAKKLMDFVCSLRS